MYYGDFDCNSRSPPAQTRSWGEILPLSLTRTENNSSFTHDLQYLVALRYLVFEMGSIAPDKVIFISMILESLLYGSRRKSFGPCSTTNKLGLGIFTVMFGFTLWVLIHERSGRINTRLLLPTLALYTLATAVSHLIEFMHWITHLLHQAFDH